MKIESKILRMADTPASAPAKDEEFQDAEDTETGGGGDADTPANPQEFVDLANDLDEDADDVAEPAKAVAEAAAEVPAEGKDAKAPAAPAKTEAEAPPAKAEAAQPVSVPATPATPPATTEVPAAQPAATPAPAVAEPAQPAAPVITPEEAAKRRKEWFDTSVNTLASSVFPMSEEDVHAFEENPKEFLPKLAATATIHAIEAAVQTILPHIPGIVEAVVISRKSSEAGEEKFFSRWPDLKKKEHFDTVLRIGNAYRAANPGATPDQFIEEVGVQTMVALRLPIPGVTTSEVPAEVITTPAAKPAGRSAPTVPASTTPQNEFTALSADPDDAFD